MTDRPITLDDVFAGKLRENGHMNFGKDGSGYPMQHTTIPRLSCIDRHYKGKAREKSGVASARLWCVDGVEVASIEEAVERLNAPAVFTDEERAFLAKVPADWIELHPFLRSMEPQVAPPASAYGLMFALRHKGAVEVERREAEKKSFIRLTPADALPSDTKEERT